MSTALQHRRKMGHIVQRGSSWYVPVYLGRRLMRDPVTGKEKWRERRRWMRFGSYREAREALPSLVGKAAKRTLVKTSNERLSEYLPRWLENHKRNIAEKTAYDYKRTLDKHILPAFGGIRLKDLEPEDIENYLTARLATGLSGTSVHHQFSLVRKALADAVRMKRLPSNPCDTVQRPKRTKPEMRAWDEEQLRMFLGTAKRTSRYYRLYLMAAATGLRQSELCGLKWENVDLVTGRLSVQTVFYRLGGRQIWKEPKSASSRRSITLSPELVEELLALKRDQDARRKELDVLYHDHSLVFCQDDGKPLHAHNVVRRDLHKVRAAAKVPRVPRPFHALRHSFTSLLANHGTPMKVIQSLLGHSSIQVTMDLYAHLQPAVRDEAIQAISDRLLATIPSNESSTETVSTVRETAGSGGKETA